jgi:hypothetical protein
LIWFIGSNLYHIVEGCTCHFDWESLAFYSESILIPILLSLWNLVIVGIRIIFIGGAFKCNLK